jgi:hypothetical protein
MRSLFLFAAAGLFAFAQDWMTMGAGGSIHTAADGAVEFRYDLGSKQFTAAVLPTDASFASMKSLRFRAKTDHDTNVAVLLSERKPGGGNYVAMFWSPANVWQQIELTPRDFNLSDSPTDPVDADGKLDLDQVEGVALLDLSSFFSQVMERDKIVVAAASGTHLLSIDKFEVRKTAPAEKPNSIDAFDRSFLQWMSPGGMTLKFIPETGPLGESSLKATYSETAGPYAILIRQVGGLELSKAKHLLFDIASEHDATMLIALETKKGGRYHLTINPPADRKVFHVDVELADFEQESGGQKFDPSIWKSIALLDISGGNSPNTYWLGNLRTSN